MSFLLFHLKRIFLFPIEFFFSPHGFMGALWNESGKSRALLLGLPAFVFALIGVSVLFWAEYGMSASLENRYQAEAEKSALEKKRLRDELAQEVRMFEASQRNEPGNARRTAAEIVPNDDPRRVELDKWLDQEEVYLQKLIDINPQEPEYKYDLAIVSMQKGNFHRGFALMNLTAPLDDPGFIKGHLWLANYHWNIVRKTTDKQERRNNAAVALRHLDQCLKRDQSNKNANRFKAMILYQFKQFADAYKIYEELFRDDVAVYSRMVEINERLNREGMNEQVLRNAISRYQQQLNDPSLEEEQRRISWDSLTRCYRKTKEFGVIEGLLLREVETFSGENGDPIKRIFAERLLATVYLSWMSSFPDETDVLKRCEYLKKAYSFDPTNDYVLLELTRMGATPAPPVEGQEFADENQRTEFEKQQQIFEDKQQAATQARALYDPSGSLDANALVLNEMGSQALSRKQYADAIEYFEAARIKSPKSPDILNNLSYTYLVSDTPNPKRALKLVDQALDYFVPQTEEAKKLLSHFHDTRGLAMMQLNRLDEATAEFEIALADRPGNKRILENLVECYRANGLDPSGWLERLKLIENEAPDKGGRAP